jgi:hypothetical protein
MASNDHAALVALLVDEAQRRLTAAYLAHGHVYTEEPERAEDILRDVLTRALTASEGAQATGEACEHSWQAEWNGYFCAWCGVQKPRLVPAPAAVREPEPSEALDLERLHQIQVNINAAIEMNAYPHELRRLLREEVQELLAALAVKGQR